MPNFAGQKGPEIVRGLIEIENTFEKNLASLRNVKKTILDVKATSWHDDYNRYSALLPHNQKTVDLHTYSLRGHFDSAEATN